MQLEGIIELVIALFEDTPVLEVLNTIIGVAGPFIGELFK